MGLLLACPGNHRRRECSSCSSERRCVSVCPAIGPGRRRSRIIIRPACFLWHNDRPHASLSVVGDGRTGEKTVERSITVPGVQPKLSLGRIRNELNTAGRGRLTVLDALKGELSSSRPLPITRSYPKTNTCP